MVDRIRTLILTDSEFEVLSYACGTRPDWAGLARFAMEQDEGRDSETGGPETGKPEMMRRNDAAQLLFTAAARLENIRELFGRLMKDADPADYPILEVLRATFGAVRHYLDESGNGLERGEKLEEIMKREMV